MNVHFYTSFWFNQELIKNRSKYIVVSISNSIPEIWENKIDDTIKEAVPDFNLVLKNKLDHNDWYYTVNYNRAIESCKEKIAKQVSELGRKSIDKNKPLVFCCWCYPKSFCHRHLFAEFLMKNWKNIFVTEL